MMHDDQTMMLLLKTVKADGSAYNGFRWPREVGATVEAPDWKPTPHCGHGLHGLPWGEGDGSLLNWDAEATWVVFESPAAEVICFDGKAKCRRATVRHIGDRLSATQYLSDHGGAGKKIVGGTATAGYRGTATAGYRGTATAGDWGTATAGDWGTATAGYRGTATAGDWGTATAGDWGTATAGYRGTATAGDRGTATAGNRGTILITWFDGDRYRVAVGYIGEDGLLPSVAYRFDATLRRFVAAEIATKETIHVARSLPTE